MTNKKISHKIVLDILPGDNCYVVTEKYTPGRCSKCGALEYKKSPEVEISARNIMKVQVRRGLKENTFDIFCIVADYGSLPITRVFKSYHVAMAFGSILLRNSKNASTKKTNRHS
jgi:hypothetical protein